MALYERPNASATRFGVAVAELLPKMPEEAYIVSVHIPYSDQKPGVVFMATPRVAAERIASGTHRIATDQEREAYLQEFEARTNAVMQRSRIGMAADELQRAMNTIPEPAVRRSPRKE